MLQEAKVATLAALNELLQTNHPELEILLELVDSPALARKASKSFTARDAQRIVNWDWEPIYHKRVKHKKDAWMFVVSSKQRYGVLCYGSINVLANCVSIEYLERHSDIVELKGWAALIAVQYAQALAVYLEITQVRIANPDPALVPYYEETFGLTRHSDGDEVLYLYKEVLP